MIYGRGMRDGWRSWMRSMDLEQVRDVHGFYKVGEHLRQIFGGRTWIRYCSIAVKYLLPISQVRYDIAIMQDLRRKRRLGAKDCRSVTLLDLSRTGFMLFGHVKEFGAIQCKLSFSSLPESVR